MDICVNAWTFASNDDAYFIVFNDIYSIVNKDTIFKPGVVMFNNQNHIVACIK